VSATKKSKGAWYVLYDAEPAVGIVRCPEGDVAAFERLADELLRHVGERPGEDYPIGPPRWRWYRHNPCATGEYSWVLGRAQSAGPGNWMGALVVHADCVAELERIEARSA
jgi:hypothetical protein